MRRWPHLNETWNLAHFSHKLTSMWIRDGDILKIIFRYCCDRIRKRKAHMQSSIINTLSMTVECFCSLKHFVWHHQKRCELKTLWYICVEWFEYFMLIQRATKVQHKVQGNSAPSNFPWMCYLSKNIMGFLLLMFQKHLFGEASYGPRSNGLLGGW